ncbi:MAG TPA: hypothetical protein VKT25_02765 [Ktedonobacteraceae bacterium]|nr:hypothetical protein [Ktedonobacteraceae bacterium]
MNRVKGLWHNRVVRLLSPILLLTMMFSVAWLPSNGASAHTAKSTCNLGTSSNPISHVIYVQFDNTHFTRDNPNVPSDLEQMPHLLNFIKNNGVMLTNQHTPLIAHTATDILTSLTGVYGDQHGVPISNSFRYFTPTGSSSVGVSFAYWTSPLYDPTTSTPTDTTYNMLTANGLNAPAPWVPYTRAGCNFGAVATANTILENTAIDVPTVFGAGSPQAIEAQANPVLAQADFVGIGIHCAQSSALCSSTNNGRPDLLPNEPGGYNGYMGLFGHKYVAPQISPSGPLTDLNGNIIQDPHGNIGFPGFDGMSASVSLSYVAAMQEHGVPVTYAYISDAHDAHPNGPAYGPGQAGYVAALKSYDNAFATFFTRLANDGINSNNTLFVFTADEGDHFVGGAPTPSNCNGVTVACNYSVIGEVNANLAGLLATQQNITTPFKVHSDAAPNIYITGNPSRTNQTVTRPFERAVGKLTAVNPITGQSGKLTNYLADPVEMNLLHMITADPNRTPTFTMFADPNYYLYAGAPNCSSPCVQVQPGFAWNHGDVSPDINTTWLGMVGPGVKHLGVDHEVWSDHTDTRPTMLELLGLKDDYQHEGRVLFEVIKENVLPNSLRDHGDVLSDLVKLFKQINAPVGELGLASLRISTKALESNSPNDATYSKLENKLSNITTARNNIAGQMVSLLEGAEFNNQHINTHLAKQLIEQAQNLLEQVGQD